MPITVVSICNEALVNVGADTIQSITQEVRRAQLLNGIFERTRDDVLRSRRWNFAKKFVTLAPNATTPDHSWDYAYDLPLDCLLVQTCGENDEIDFEVVGERMIFTDEPEEIDVTYTYRNEDPSSWDPLFASALAWKLSYKISYALTQSLSLKEHCGKQFEKVLREAAYIDGAEGILKGLEADTWTNARR
jgi:hypothetical protein